MMDTPIWLSLANTAAIITLTSVLYVKLHRLRLAWLAGQLIQTELAQSLEKMRTQQPPIILGETWWAERLEHIDRVQADILARIIEIERATGLTNGAGSG